MEPSAGERTEPGPSAVGEEVMSVPFYVRVRSHDRLRAGASRQWWSLAFTLACDTGQREWLRQVRRFADAGQ